MSPSLLPPELILAVALHLPVSALPALALTCSAFSHIAQRALYRHLAPSPRHLPLLALLASRPHIARHVRSFHFALDPAAPVFARFYTLLARALHNMSELHSLHLFVDHSASWLLRLPASRTAYPNLVHFTASFSLDHHVVRFLRLTPSLRQLELDSIPSIPLPSSPCPSLPATSIPRLEQFIGSSRAASVIVPGRPVSSIHLNASVLLDDDIPLLARSTAHILVLAAVTSTPPVPFLQLLRRHLPHLAYLRVMSTQNLLPPSPEFYEQVSSVLDSFSHLNAFELSGIHWGSHQKRDKDSKRVWQSSPPSCTTHHTTDDIMLRPDIFLAY